VTGFFERQSVFLSELSKSLVLLLVQLSLDMFGIVATHSDLPDVVGM
jgi:hypothetical protein